MKFSEQVRCESDSELVMKTRRDSMGNEISASNKNYHI